MSLPYFRAEQDMRQVATLPPCCECRDCCQLRHEDYEAQPRVILVAGVGWVDRVTSAHRIGPRALSANEVLGLTRPMARP
jgi:hypothetical protein